MPSSKDLVYLVNGVLVDFAGRRLNLQNIGLLGPTGSNGDPGPTGPQGITGPTGPSGGTAAGGSAAGGGGTYS